MDESPGIRCEILLESPGNTVSAASTLEDFFITEIDGFLPASPSPVNWPPNI